MNLLAHLTNVEGVRKEQNLKEHCFNVAEYAAESIGSVKLYHTVYLAGLLHDLGKAKAEFVEYLEESFQGKNIKKGTINHTFIGVIWLFEKYHKVTSTKWEKLTCEIIGYAIGSHHGTFDCTDLNGKNGFLHRMKTDKKELCYEEAVYNYFTQVAEEIFIEEYFQKAVQEIEDFFNTVKSTYDNSGGKVFFQVSILVRLVLSAVIYGDRRDTSEFMNQRKKVREPELKWEERRKYFENEISKLDSSTMLNQVRRDISCQCLEAASRSSGIYRLNVPTGAGKTLCSLRYALAHAEKYNKKRIIFIIPLLSVLDQNVKVIQDYLPNKTEILEHHSNVIHEESDGEKVDKYEFLGESWNFPIVVSTLVQLLNILFSYQTSALGRMQALCDSVIVIDEVQTLPKKATVMFCMVINFLQQYCNASIVLSSATQPCFEDLKWPLHLMEKPDMVCLNQEQFQVFERTEIINQTNPYGMDWDECVEFCIEQIQRHTSLLVICNTKMEARILFEKLQMQVGCQECDIFHLSTAMCQEHRMNVLEKLSENLFKLQQVLRKNMKIRKQICISTQLIEAGVDLSFECVIRVLAGIDNLAQAAGRCNRSNEYGQLGKVYLINLKNENLSMLQEIKNAQDSTLKVVGIWDREKESLIGEKLTRKFYRFLFEETRNEIRYPIKEYGMTVYLVDLLSNINFSAENDENRNYFLHQPFKTIGEEFKVFDQNTIDIVIPYGQGQYLIEHLEAMQNQKFNLERLKKIIQQAKKYTVSIYEWQMKKLNQAGMLYSILDDRVLILNKHAYNDQFGLTILDEQAVENYIL